MRFTPRQQRCAHGLQSQNCPLRHLAGRVHRYSAHFVIHVLITTAIFFSGEVLSQSQLQLQAQGASQTQARYLLAPLLASSQAPPISGQLSSSLSGADQNHAPSLSGYYEVAATPTVASAPELTDTSTVVSSEVDPVYRLDINTATAEQLDDVLPGIGPEKAQRIIAWIAANGPFQTIDQLIEVRGIGPKTLELIRPYVRVGDAVTTSNSHTTTRSLESQTKLAVQKIVAAAKLEASSVTGLAAR